MSTYFGSIIFKKKNKNFTMLQNTVSCEPNATDTTKVLTFN